MLARAFQNQLTTAGVEFVGTDRELDISAEEVVRGFAEDGQFSHIINCAAYTRVDDAETDTETADAVNVRGARNLAQAAKAIEASFVHFSTDYVFSGQAKEPYVESAQCAPQGVYAKTKRVGEQQVQLTLPNDDSRRRVQVIRTSWLFGEGGNNFVATMLRLMAEREQLRVVHDQVGRPTYTVDLAEAALVLAGIAPGTPACSSGFYHFANAGVTSWCDFSRSILAMGKELGFSMRALAIEPITTAEFPRPAPRPAYSVLSTSRYEKATGREPRHWRDALRQYLTNLKEDA